jgi:hypothetical protein
MQPQSASVEVLPHSQHEPEYAVATDTMNNNAMDNPKMVLDVFIFTYLRKVSLSLDILRLEAKIGGIM